MSLFPDIEDAVAVLRRDRLAAPHLASASFSDDYLAGQLLAAEADAESALRVYLSPVEILPETATQEDKDLLDDEGIRWEEEPGYDLEPDFFSGERWGYLLTRQRPIIAVHSLQFVYPAPFRGIFTVPADWIRLDKKYGHIRLVPGSQSFNAPLSIGVMQVLGGGRGIPQMLQLRYTAGLQNAASKYPDLLDLVQRMAALRLLQGLFPAASGSISADGLSESTSMDLSKYQSDIDSHLERLRQRLQGPQLIVC